MSGSSESELSDVDVKPLVASPVAAAAAVTETPAAVITAPADSLTEISNSQPSETYASRVQARRALYRLPADTTTPQSYSFEPLLTIPHATSVHAIAVPPCCTHIFTGGADGYIRKYSLYESLNGKSVKPDSNLIAKPPYNYTPSSATIAVNGATPHLSGYWENTDADETAPASERLSRAQFGTRSIGAEETPSAVHSLLVQDDELWGLAGSDNGCINLFSIRLDEGHVRHSFRHSTDPSNGHAAGSPVSAMALTSDGTGFVSGGWDKRVLVSHCYNPALNDMSDPFLTAMGSEYWLSCSILPTCLEPTFFAFISPRKLYRLYVRRHRDGRQHHNGPTL